MNKVSLPDKKPRAIVDEHMLVVVADDLRCVHRPAELFNKLKWIIPLFT